jgi:hypothetical protein
VTLNEVEIQLLKYATPTEDNLPRMPDKKQDGQTSVNLKLGCLGLSNQLRE